MNQTQSLTGRYVVVTGLSGSGKSTVLRALEDLGFYAVDNLPTRLLPEFVRLPLQPVGQGFKAALGMDVREPDFLELFPRLRRDLAAQGLDIEVIYLEASDEALIRRFSQTRRQHPLAAQAGGLEAGIRLERDRTRPIRDMAQHVLDTSRFNIHDLKGEVFRLYENAAPPAPFHVSLLSFGFKYGLPPEADLVMDVRFLANPYFIDDLRPLDGRDQRVVDYVFGQDTTTEFLNRYKDLLSFLLPLYRAEGKSRLTVAVGCTGGKHRSVAVAEWLAAHLDAPEARLTLRHRDVTLG